MLPPVGAARGGLSLGKKAPSSITKKQNLSCDCPDPLPPSALMSPLHSEV